MQFGNIDISREMMPSYQLLQDYPSRQYQFMQDTLNGALQARQQVATAQQPNAAGMIQNNAPNQSSTWGQ